MDYMDYVDYVEGGVETLKHKYPWLVYFKRISKAEVLKPGRTIPGKINLACTGALLDQTHVLIAAHCINKKDFQQFTYEVQGFTHNNNNLLCNYCTEGCGSGAKIYVQVYVGAHICEVDKNNYMECKGAEERNVRKVDNLDNFLCHYNGTCTRPFNTYQCYRGCKKGIEGSDIAVITLDRLVQFSRKIRPICLPANPSIKQFETKTAVAAGWGSTKHNSKKTSPTPREAEVKVLKHKACEGQWETLDNGTRVPLPFKNDEGIERSGWGGAYSSTIHLCTHGLHQMVNGPRAGDSGSALNFKENGRFSNIYIYATTFIQEDWPSLIQ